LPSTATATNNYFAAKWNGATLIDQTNIVPGGWTNMQFTVSATGASSSLEIDFYNKQGAFGLDDITVDVAPPPSGPLFQPVTLSSGTNLLISWPLSAAGFQLQSSTNLGMPNSWLNVVTALTTNGGTISTLVPLQGPQQFFRLKQ
ncbi:MAG TPA: hypothetical protein VGF90_07340, partial [Verrucomicrobiae bacterium]